MKKHTLHSPLLTGVVILVLGLFFNSCARPLQLSFQVPQDMNYRYKATNITNTDSKVMGMDVSATSVQEYTYSMKAKTPATANTYPVEIKYERIKTSQSAMGTTTEYDSDNKEASSDPNDAVYQAMLNTPFEVVFTSEGKIEEAKGLDKMLEGAFDGLDPQVAATLKAQFGNEALLMMFENMNSYLPNKAIKKGESWTIPQTVNVMGMNMEISTTYTLKERKDGMSNIDFTGEIVVDPEKSVMEMMEMQMVYDLKGTLEGTMLVEEASSWISKMQGSQRIGGQLTMKSDAMGEMKMDMDLDIDSNIERIE